MKNHQITMADSIIESVEYYDYRPPTSEDINIQNTEFPIKVYNEDIVTQPSKSLLVISGKVELMEITNDAESSSMYKLVDSPSPDDLHFLNNGVLRFFDRIDYYIGDEKIDSIRRPGTATTMKGLACFESDIKYSNTGWRIKNPDEYIMNKTGNFSVCIPMSIIMGFFEDYKKFLFRMPQRLVFYRTNNLFQNALYLNTIKYKPATHKLFVKLKDITWRMPQLKLSLAYETKVRKAILESTDYEMSYRGWLHHVISGISGMDFTWDIPTCYSKTKFVLIGFQARNSGEFKLQNLNNVQIVLNNNVHYPRERLNMNVGERRCSNLYQMFKEFKCSYYNKELDDVEPIVDYTQFLENYPIIAIDCSFQPTIIKESLINIKVIFNWHDVFPSDMEIHVMLISDKKAIYNPLHNRVIQS